MAGPNDKPNDTPRRASRWRRLRRLLAVVALLVILVGGGSYFYLTHPARLGLLAEDFLAKRWFGPATFADVHFSPWNGLVVEDLRLYAVPDEALGVREPLEVLAADAVELPLRLGQLVRGDVVPRAIRAGSVRLTLFQSEQVGEQVEFDEPQGNPLAGVGRWPVFQADSFTLRLAELVEGRTRLDEQWNLAAVGRPIRDGATTGYRFTLLEQRARPARRLVDVEVDAAAQTVTGAVDWMPVTTVQRLLAQFLPPAVALGEEFEKWDVTGQLQVEGFSWRPETAPTATIALRDVSGTVPIESDDPAVPRYVTLNDFGGAFVWSPEGLRGELRGRLREAETRLALQLRRAPVEASVDKGRWVLESDFDITGLALPDVERDSDFIRAERMVGAVREFFLDYTPTGWVDATGTVRYVAGNEAARGELDFEVLVEPQDASISYYRFPYRIREISGVFRITDDGMFLENLVGRHGSGRIVANGKLDEPYNWTGFDLHFDAENVPLDAALYDALPENYRVLWDQTLPLGLCDVRVTLTRLPGTESSGPLDVAADVSANMLSGSLAFEDARLISATGRFAFGDGRVDVEQLRGEYRGAPVSFHGHAASAGDAVRQYWSFRLAGLAIEQRERVLTEPRLEAEDPDVSQVTYRGDTNVWGQTWRAPGEEAQRYYVAELLDGELWLFDAETPWQTRGGQLVVGPESQRLDDFAARKPTGDLTLSGLLQRTTDEGVVPVELIVRVESPADSAAVGATADGELADGAIGVLLRELMPPQWRHVVERLGLSGAGAATLALRGAEDATSAEDFVAGIDLKVASMESPLWPLPLRDVTATLAFTSETLLLNQAEATYGADARIELTGSGAWNGDDPRFVLTAVMRQIELDEPFVASLPQRLREFVEQLSPSGLLDARLAEVEIVASEPAVWRVHGGLAFEDAALNLGLPLTEFAGRIDSQHPAHVEIAGKDVTAEALFVIERGRLAGRALTECSGRLVVRPDREWVAIEELSGRLCGGEVRGQGQIKPATDEYRIELSLHNLDFTSFVEAELDPDERPLAARLDGRLHVGGISDDPATRRGGGALRIRAAPTAATPVLRDVAELSAATGRQLPQNADLIELRFDWLGETLLIRQVDIVTPTTHLVGKGEWNLASNTIDATLIAAPPDVPLVPPFNLLDIAREELAQYRVTGSVDEPQVAIEPLYNLAEALREMLEGEGARR